MLVIDPITNLFKDTLMNTSAQGELTPCAMASASILICGSAGHAEMIMIMEDIAELTYSMNLLTIVSGLTSY